MITFYNRNESDFKHNGLGCLDNYIINPVVCEDQNGIFSLEFDYPTNAPHADGLLQERIVRCPVPGVPMRIIFSFLPINSRVSNSSNLGRKKVDQFSIRMDCFFRPFLFYHIHKLHRPNL